MCRCSPSIGALILLLAVPAAAQSELAIPLLSADEISRLNEGEIMAQLTSGDIREGYAWGIVDARADDVIPLLAQPDHHRLLFDDMIRAEIVGREGQFQLVRGVTDTPWPMPDREWTIRYWQGRTQLDGVRVWMATWDYVPGSGNMIDFEGYWVLIPWGDGSRTLVGYHMAVDLGTWVPGQWVRWTADDVLPQRIQAIRARLARQS